MGKEAAEEKQGRKPWTLREFGGQTVWDWLHLLSALAIPVVLAIVGFWFTAQQDARQQQTENQRAEAERELAEQRAQDEALQAYLDQMSQLMLERNLLEAEPGDPVHTLAQARTSTVIFRLDAEHNQSVTRFLSDSGLAVRGKASAKLLEGIVLSHATLSDADLFKADLSRADLSDADLSGAGLSEADLSGAGLSGADLSGADLSGADLFTAKVIGADLRDTDLSGADLRGANLGGSDLSDADLSGADLSGVVVMPNEELERQAASLEGATMPNGQKYEEWLKDK